MSVEGEASLTPARTPARHHHGATHVRCVQPGSLWETLEKEDVGLLLGPAGPLSGLPQQVTFMTFWTKGEAAGFLERLFRHFLAHVVFLLKCLQLSLVAGAMAATLRTGDMGHELMERL